MLGIISSTAEAGAQDGISAAPKVVPQGFYGGVAVRDSRNVAPGIDFSSVSSSWLKYAPAIGADGGTQSLLFGGYRFANDIALEAAFARTDTPALANNRPGMGLALASPSDALAHVWNADLYTSYSFVPAFALFGRVGYRQSDELPAYLLVDHDASAARQGVNYGVGLRYDMSPSLGLKLEYARFGQFPVSAFNAAISESDEVRFGVQYRF